MKSNPESRSDDLNVICPHCGDEYQAEAEDYSDSEVEEVCCNCGREYLRWTEFSVTHHTKAKP